jgi:membrane associated rhomboid family serine protease
MNYDPEYTRIGFPRPTPAIGQLMVVNLVVFVANMLLGGRLSDGEAGSGMWLALSWDAIWEGWGLGMLRFLSYQFTHSFHDPWHILWNFVFLYYFGGMTERAIGYRGALKLYLVGGLVAGMLHMAGYGLMFGEPVPVVGASGSCYALVLFAVCTEPRKEYRVLFFKFQLIFLGFVLVGVAVYVTYVEVVKGLSGGVSHGAHLGGALFGMLVWKTGWFRDYREHAGVVPFAGLQQRFQRWRAQRHAAASAADQAEMDRILDKVHRDGLQSLSAGERRVLERQSRRARKD